MNTPTRLENFPISFFAMVMGLSGVTIAWQKAQHVFHVDLHISPWMVGMTAAVFVALAGIYGAKLLNRPGNAGDSFV
jgi:tellurite resistance protein